MLAKLLKYLCQSVQKCQIAKSKTSIKKKLKNIKVKLRRTESIPATARLELKRIPVKC
jgi:hypothetical protein